MSHADVYDKLVKGYGKENVLTKATLLDSYEVIQFMAPYVLCNRRKDDVKVTFRFTHIPRFYFDEVEV